jgi:hypothetical protein
VVGGLPRPRPPSAEDTDRRIEWRQSWSFTPRVAGQSTVLLPGGIDAAIRRRRGPTSHLWREPALPPFDSSIGV